MTWRRTPLWVGLGGATLAFTAGYVNAVGFVGSQQHGLTHVTGQVTKVGIQLASGGWADAWRAGNLIWWFFLGAVLSGMLIRNVELSRTRRRYGVVMLLEAGLLAIAGWRLSLGDPNGDDILAMAAGLQNAMATSYSGAVVRTTHMTGIVTDFGLLIGHALRDRKTDVRKLGLLALLFGSFLLGGMGGALAVPRLGSDALTLAAAWLVAAAVAYLVQARRHAETTHAPHSQKAE